MANITRVTSTGIVLGETYIDDVHSIKGIATSVSLFLHGCSRVCLEYIDADGKIAEQYFDIGQLTHQKTKTKPGAKAEAVPG